MDEEREKARGLCLQCGAPLPKGRSDMKFCGSVCRSRYHYEQGGAFRALRRRIIAVLDRNHRLLEEALESGVPALDAEELALRGFDFLHATCFVLRKGGIELRCYDISYRLTKGKVFKLRKVSGSAEDG